MRRMILTSLVLLPVMAHAAARTSVEPQQPSSSSAVLVAELTQPVALAGLDLKAATLPVAKIHAMMGMAPSTSSAPRVTKAVEMSLSPAELADQPAVSKVVVRAIVDANGVPRNVAVSHSAGSLIDRKAIEAVSQYRFVPATLDNEPTSGSVSITIKIEKP